MSRWDESRGYRDNGRREYDRFSPPPDRRRDSGRRSPGYDMRDERRRSPYPPDHDWRRYDDMQRPRYDDYPPYLDRRDYEPRRRSPPPYASSIPLHSGSSRPPAKPMAPTSQSVILLGLPQNCDEAMLRQFLEHMGCAVDSCTIIYDRSTGQSKRFGFAKFVSVEHARAFVEPNYPTVIWQDKSGRGLPEDEGLKIKIDFSTTEKSEKYPQMRPPAPSSGTSSVPNAGSVIAGLPVKSALAAANLPPNDGTRDIGPLPNSMLLLRGLDPLTKESDIGAAIDKLPDLRPDERPRQILHIKDRQNKGSLGFVFVVFKDAKTAADVLSKIWNPEIHQQGWRIRGHAVTATFGHGESFRPAYAESSWSFRNEAGKELLYWDERAFVSLWSPNGTQSSAISSKPSGATVSATPIDEADEFLASFGAPELPTVAEAVKAENPVSPASTNGISASAAVSNPARNSSAPSAAGISAASLQAEAALRDKVLAQQDKSALLSPRASSTSTSSPTKTTENPTVAPIEASKASQPTASTSKKEKKQAELIASRKAAPNIAKWNEKKSELHPESQSKPGPLKRKLPEDPIAEVDPFPYGDATRMICLLCQRQFKIVEDLARHDELSQLHRNNLTDPTLVQAATEKKASLQAPQYRDRAAERRQALNQPDKPAPEAKKHRKDPKQGPLPSVPASDATQGISEHNIGAKMLAAAGWKQGEGLGSGRSEPVQAKVYAAGAGLGAGTGIDATQAGGSWNAPVTGREKAKQRFNERT